MLQISHFQSCFAACKSGFLRTGSGLQVGQKYGLPVRSPLDDGGVFTSEAGSAFEGKCVLGDGNTAVVSALKEAAALLKVGSYMCTVKAPRHHGILLHIARRSCYHMIVMKEAGNAAMLA